MQIFYYIIYYAVVALSDRNIQLLEVVVQQVESWFVMYVFKIQQSGSIWKLDILMPLTQNPQNQVYLITAANTAEGSNPSHKSDKTQRSGHT